MSSDTGDGTGVAAFRRVRAAQNRGVAALLERLPAPEDLDGWHREIERCESDAVMAAIAERCPPEMIASAVYTSAERGRFHLGLRTALSRVPLPEDAQQAAMEMGDLPMLFLAQSTQALPQHLAQMLEVATGYDVEEQALGNGNLPVELLVERFDSGDELDMAAALYNPALPLEKITAAIGHDDPRVDATARYFLGRARLAAGLPGGLSDTHRKAVEEMAKSCSGCAQEKAESAAVDFDYHSDACLEWHMEPQAWAKERSMEQAEGVAAGGEATLERMVTAALRGEMARRAGAAEKALAEVRDVVETWIDAGFAEASAHDAIAGALEDPDAYFNTVLVQWPSRVASMSNMDLDPQLRQEAATWWRDAGLGPPEALAAVIGVELPDADGLGMEL